MDILSRQQVTKYLSDTLNIQHWAEQFSLQPLKLLNEVIYKLHGSLPYQNLKHLSKPLKERQPVGKEESVKNLLNGSGGMCWENNVAVYALLTVLGYSPELYLVNVVLERPGAIGNHALIVVSDVLKEGDRYLVDLGMAFPHFQAINLELNENGESDIMTQSFKTYKIVKRNDHFVRVHRKVTLGDRGHDASSEWHDAYHFQLVKNSHEEIQRSISQAEYTRPDGLFNNSLRCMSWINGKYIGICDNILLKEDATGKLQPERISNEKEFLELCARYFPKIDEDIIRKALISVPLCTEQMHNLFV